MKKAPIGDSFLESIKHQFHLLTEDIAKDSSRLLEKADSTIEKDDSQKEHRLINNKKGAEVEVLVSRGNFIKGTRGHIVTSYTIPDTNINTCCVRKQVNVTDLSRIEFGWFLENELKNV